MKTIKQLADELGVSKTAIRKRFSEEFKVQYVSISPDGSLQITDEGCKLIAESLRKPLETLPKFPGTETETIGNRSLLMADGLRKSPETLPKFPETKAETIENRSLQAVSSIQQDTISILTNQLAAKDEQIKAMQVQLSERDKQISQLTSALENMSTALTAAQALHAGTIQERLGMQENDSEQPVKTDTQSAEAEPAAKQGFFAKLFRRKRS